MKKIKWLEYFKDFMDVGSFTFIEQFDAQLRPQFETYFGREMDWKKLLLFIEPSTEVLFFNEVQGIKIGLLFCSLNYGSWPIYCQIAWRSEDGSQFIRPEMKELNERLIFKLYKFDDSHELASKFPGIDSEPELLRLGSALNFPVYLLNGVISHEGNLLISFKDNSKVEEVQRIFTRVQALWNDDDRVIESFPAYRGKLHQIYFTEWTEEGQAEFYYDTGSAIDGVHEYLISSLKEMEDDILKVELEAI